MCACKVNFQISVRKLRLQTGHLLAGGSGMAMSLSGCARWSGSAGNRLLVSRSERFLPLRNEINVGSLKTSLHLREACSTGWYSLMILFRQPSAGL